MTEITVDQAVSAIRRDYYSDVLDLARDLAERMKAGEVDDFRDALHETVDGCARVIYTFQAKLGLLASDNEDAAADENKWAPRQIRDALNGKVPRWDDRERPLYDSSPRGDK